MDKIKVAWIVTHPIQYQVPLIKYLSNNSKLEITVIYFSDFSTKNYVDKEFNRNIKWDTPLLGGYNHVVLKNLFEFKGNISFLNPIIIGLFNKIKRNDYDIVIIHGWNHYGYIYALFLSKIKKIKVFLRCEVSSHLAEKTGLFGRIRKFILNIIFNNIDHFLFIGESNKNYYLNNGIESSKLTLMPYAVDNNFFIKKFNEINIHETKRFFELEIDRPVILYSSKLIKRKRVDFLLEAYSKLNLYKMPYLLIVGDGELKTCIQKTINNSEFSKFIKIVGFKNQSELPLYYAVADIFVLASVDETWGLVINEAMNFKLAILTSNKVGSAQDLVINGQNGVIIDPYDLKSLTSAIDYMISDQNYILMGEKSRQIIDKWGFKENLIGLTLALEKSFINK